MTRSLGHNRYGHFIWVAVIASLPAAGLLLGAGPARTVPAAESPNQEQDRPGKSPGETQQQRDVGGDANSEEDSTAEFDYRRLRKELELERSRQRAASEKILGLPTEQFFEPVEGSSVADTLGSGILAKAIGRFASRVTPNQGGVVWIFVVLLGLLALDRKRLFSLRNLDVVMLPAVAFLLIDLIPLGEGAVGDSNQRTLAALVFAGIFALSCGWLVRCLIGSLHHRESGLASFLPLRVLVPVAGVLFGINVLLCLGRNPDDCGIFTNIGAARLYETGKFPYGDEKLRGGAAATYGPVLYVAHVPFQVLLPKPPPAADGEGSANEEFSPPPLLATKLCQLAFHVLGLAALIVIGRQLGDIRFGWTLACLYAGSPYVQGLGGSETAICGMTFISHIAPTACLLVAFALLRKPAASGAMLGVATGVLFFPVFLVPAWFGYYFWQRRGWWKFLAGYGLMGLVIGSTVLLMTDSQPNESAFDAVFKSTVAHQEHPEAYGASPFSFWGTHPEIRAFWHQPLFRDSFLMKPAFLVYLALIAASFFMARGRSPSQFAFLIAALTLGVQLWKSHATGTYVEWYLPFLLIGIFGPARSAVSQRQRRDTSSSAHGRDADG